MSKGNKLIAAMRANPRDWGIGDIERACHAAGLTCVAPKRGSHYKITHPSISAILTVPYNRPIKPVYVRELIKLIDRLERRP